MKMYWHDLAEGGLVLMILCIRTFDFLAIETHLLALLHSRSRAREASRSLERRIRLERLEQLVKSELPATLVAFLDLNVSS